MNQKKEIRVMDTFSGGAAFDAVHRSVKASEPQIQDVNIQMVGGQIRTIDPMGLRMVACIKKSYIQELEKSGATVKLWNRTASEKVFDRRSGIDA